jgi:hypothetical protein
VLPSFLSVTTFLSRLYISSCPDRRRQGAIGTRRTCQGAVGCPRGPEVPRLFVHRKSHVQISVDSASCGFCMHDVRNWGHDTDELTGSRALVRPGRGTISPTEYARDQPRGVLQCNCVRACGLCPLPNLAPRRFSFGLIDHILQRGKPLSHREKCLWLHYLDNKESRRLLPLPLDKGGAIAINFPTALFSTRLLPFRI